MGSWKKLLPSFPVVLLTLGAILFGLLAWREASRAGGTAWVLLSDYASFIAERLVRQTTERYQAFMGPRQGDWEAARFEPLPLDTLSKHAQSMTRDVSPELPPPVWPYVRYVFCYDGATDTLNMAGRNITEEDRETLWKALDSLSPQCAASRLIPFNRFENLEPDFGLGRQNGVEWSGWLQTNESGGLLHMCGALLDSEEAVKTFIVPLITGDDECGCPTMLLPESLASISDARRAASFSIRNGRGEILYGSEPAYEASPSVVHPFAAGVPFPGWTVEVAVNPAVVQPLLPYGGQGIPWLVLTLLFVLVIGSAGLAVRSLRRNVELLRIQQDFVGNVSHELRTPLARIRLFNELLMAGRQSDTSKPLRYRAIIDRECRRLSFLVDNVLDFSRNKRNGRDSARSELNLRQVVDDGLEAFRSLSDHERFTLTEHLEDVPPVLGDASRLQQALINLLDNAVKYSPEGASIEVELTAAKGVAVLSVRDEGSGIPLAEQECIFGEFYRVESGEAQRKAGSGLGLSLVKQTVEAHGGRVKVQSEEGQGSLFIVEIPTIACASRRGAPDQKAEKVSV